MTTDFVLAGTGSRSLRTADRAVQVDAMERCAARIAQRILEHDKDLVVMSGMAEGWDELIARTALKLGVRLWCAIPNKGYIGHYWGRASLLERDRMAEAREILGQAWKVTYVMESVHDTKALKHEGLHANFWRNLFMIEQADDFAVWNPTSKGTAHCVREIKKAGKWKDDMILSPQDAAAESASHAA